MRAGLLVAVALAASSTGVRVPLVNGLVLYQAAQSGPTPHVVMRVVDTKIDVDALAYEARPAASTLWSGAHVAVNAASLGAAFGVTYHRGRGADDDDVVVACERVMKISTIHCVETPLATWQRAFPGATRQQILERAAAQPRRTQRQSATKATKVTKQGRKPLVVFEPFVAIRLCDLCGYLGRTTNSPRVSLWRASLVRFE